MKLNGKPGDTIKVGDILVVIGETGEELPEKTQSVEVIKRDQKIQSQVTAIGDQTPSDDKILAIPKVRQLAKDLNIDLSNISGSGPEGRITEDDVKSFSEDKKIGFKTDEKIDEPKVTFDKYGSVLKIPLKGMRKTIAEKMVKSYTKIPHVTHTDEADITELVRIKDKEKSVAENFGVRLTYLPFVIKALLAALKEHPYLNSSLNEETGEIIVKKYYNIGIAVQTSDGLMVFVVKNVDDKSIIELAKEIQDLSEKARARRIPLDDLKGSTFTITNYGSIGGIFGTPIINYPEAAILGLGKIQEKPVVRDAKILVRKIFPLSLTFDHRILDGAEVAAFMNDLIKRLEDPDELLIYTD